MLSRRDTDGCVIAFEYVGQLNDEEDAATSESRYGGEKGPQSQNVTIVTQPAYAFNATPNAMGGRASYAPSTPRAGPAPQGSF